MVAITRSATQSAYVNVVSDLAYARILHLMASGDSVEDAVAKADGELYAQLSFAGTAGDPGVAATALNLLGGDDAQAAYVLSASAVVLAASASADAGVQPFLDGLASDLATAGALTAADQASLKGAVACVEPDEVSSLLEARFAHVGATAPVPNVNLALDTDGDGVVNAADTCVLIANPDQAVVPNGICNYEYVYPAAPSSDVGTCIGLPSLSGDIIVADLDSTNGEDILAVGCTDVFLWLNQGGGAFAAPVGLGIDALLGVPAGSRSLVSWLAAAVVQYTECSTSTVCTLPGSGTGQSLVYLPGDGAGHLGDAVAITTGFAGFANAVVSDLNGDGSADVAGTSGLLALVILSKAGGGWDSPVSVTLPGTSNPTGLSAADMRSDGFIDLVVSTDGGGVYFLAGDGTGAYSSPSSAWLGLGTNVLNLAVTDVDLDGHPDLVGTSYRTTSALEIVWGDGTLAPSGATYDVETAPVFACSAGATSPCSGACAIPFAIGDATGDGKPDLFAGNYPAIAVNSGARTFAAPVALWSAGFNGGASGFNVLADLNGDGVADALTNVDSVTVVLIDQPEHFSW
jgi:hypothetical protein